MTTVPLLGCVRLVGHTVRFVLGVSISVSLGNTGTSTGVSFGVTTMSGFPIGLSFTGVMVIETGVGLLCRFVGSQALYVKESVPK